MVKFKEGDVVKCVRKGGIHLTAGTEYQVIQIRKDSYIQIVNDGGYMVFYHPNYFELAGNLDFTKPLRTISGKEVKIITTEGRGKFPVLGYVGESEQVYLFTKEGVSSYNIYHNLENYAPMIPIKDYWLLVYPDGSSLKQDNFESTLTRVGVIARLHITMDNVEQGKFDIPPEYIFEPGDKVKYLKDDTREDLGLDPTKTYVVLKFYREKGTVAVQGDGNEKWLGLVTDFKRE